MKNLRVLIVLGVVLVVSLIAGAYAAGQDRRAFTAADAREVAIRAFTYSGFDSVEVSGEPRAEVFNQAAALAEQGGAETQRMAEAATDRLPVWVVPVTLSGQPVELYLSRTSGELVNLDDALPEGGFVLTPEQFARLDQFQLDLLGEELRSQRQTPALVAGLLIVLAALLLAFAVLRRRGRERRREPASPSSSEAVETDASPASG